MVEMLVINHKLNDVRGRDVHGEIIDAYANRAVDPARLEALINEMWDIAPEIDEDYEDLVDWLEFRGYLD